MRAFHSLRLWLDDEHNPMVYIVWGPNGGGYDWKSVDSFWLDKVRALERMAELGPAFTVTEAACADGGGEQ